MTDNEIQERLFSLFKQTDDLLVRVMSDGNAGIGGVDRQSLLERLADNLYHARQRVSSAIAEIIMKEKANEKV